MLGIQIFCFTCKANSIGDLPMTLPTALTDFIFFSPENTHLQIDVSCLFIFFFIVFSFKFVNQENN